MGAQAAALLDAAFAGAPLGDVPPDVSPEPGSGGVQLRRPRGYDLRRTALAHGGVGLAPTAWDGARLHLRLPSAVAVDEALQVSWRGASPYLGQLRRVLALEVDVAPLWDACDAAGLDWVRRRGAGRFLRSPTVWQDVVLALAQVRTTYRAAQARVRRLVGGGPFPRPRDVAPRDALPGWAFRGEWVIALARDVVEGRRDLEAWTDPGLPDDQVHAELLELPGVGPFTAAQLLPLLGRPRPMEFDGWLRAALGGADDATLRRRYAAAGRWAGTVAWLDALAPRLA